MCSSDLDNKYVGDVAVVPMPDKIKGQVPIAFAVLKKGKPSKKLEQKLRKHVDLKIGPTARPARIFFVQDLPKTRSGKIMRRILRKIASNQIDNLGDTSTLADPSVVDHLIENRVKIKI